MDISGINLGNINPGNQPESSKAEGGEQVHNFNPEAQAAMPDSSGARQAMIKMGDGSPAITKSADGTYETSVEAIGDVKLTESGLESFAQRVMQGIRTQEQAIVNSAEHFGAGSPDARSAIGSVYLAL